MPQSREAHRAKDFAPLVDSASTAIFALARDTSLEPALQYYAKVLTFYLQGDLERLELTKLELDSLDCGNGAEAAELKAALAEITELRLRLRRIDLSHAYLNSVAEKNFGTLFNAEKEFLLGLAWEKLGDDKEAAKHAALAAPLYREAGCPRKSVRAYYNVIAAESRIYPHKNFIADCQAAITMAHEVGEKSIEGMALIMLSREYQVIGAKEKSLEMAQAAADCMAVERGSWHFYHAGLHLAHLWIECGQIGKARELIQEAGLAPFRDIVAIRSLLLASIDPAHSWDETLEKDLIPTWRNRVPTLLASAAAKISEAGGYSLLEERLLKLAYNGPIEKWDLIAKLYPEPAPPLALENRLKNLLARVRKKNPDLVHCRDGRYHVEKLPHASLT